MTIKEVSRALSRQPQAAARVRGSEAYPDIRGEVRFYQTDSGTLVAAKVRGLPGGKGCETRVFGMHIHSGGECAGDESDPFADAMAHYNPDGCPHPQHRGDLPPLFGNSGSALLVTLTDRFTVEEVLGRTVIIHEHPDDFRTQPAGNSGRKIACGVIEACRCQR